MGRLAIRRFAIGTRHRETLPLILRASKQTQGNPCSPVQPDSCMGLSTSDSSGDSPHSSRSSEQARQSQVAVSEAHVFTAGRGGMGAGAVARTRHAFFCATLLAEALAGLRTARAGLRDAVSGCLRTGAAGLRDARRGCLRGWGTAGQRAFVAAPAYSRKTFTGIGTVAAGLRAPRLNELAFAAVGRGLTFA
jgi:hypothetical protein